MSAPENHPIPPPSTDWHALPAEDAARRLGADPACGLTSADAAQRLLSHGANRLPEPPHRPAWLRFLAQFHNPLIYVLLAAGLVTLALGSLVDAGVILGVVLINAVIGHVQEGKAERALDAVRGMLAAHATVLRDGERRQIDAGELVPGDTVLLEAGDKVPADLRLLRAKNLRAVESALTGESAPVDKDTGVADAAAGVGDRRGICHSGTLVAYGTGCGVVVATGARTEIGRIGALVGEVQTLATPLTRRLDRFARQITGFILVVAVLTMLYGRFVAGMPMFDLFLAVVGLAVAAIPEGMPAVATVVLAIGTRVMPGKSATVRPSSAVGTQGSASVIDTGSTGTLTKKAMTAVRLVLPRRRVAVPGAGHAPIGGFHVDGAAVDPASVPGRDASVRCAAWRNDARIVHARVGGWVVTGDPTEGPRVRRVHRAGSIRPAHHRRTWLDRGSSLEVARTAAVNAIVSLERFGRLDVDRLTPHVFRAETLRGHPMVLVVGGILIVPQFECTCAPPVHHLFERAPLDAQCCRAILAFGLGLFLLVELEKALLRGRMVLRP